VEACVQQSQFRVGCLVVFLVAVMLIVAIAAAVVTDKSFTVKTVGFWDIHMFKK